MYINAYKCRAVGLTINEVKCMLFASSEPNEELMEKMYSSIPVRLERYGLIELVGGTWYLTGAGQKKLDLCVPQKREERTA